MELKEKIELVERLKKDQVRLKKELEIAEKNSDSSEIDRINGDIENIVLNIKEVNQKFRFQMENRTEDKKIKEEANAFLTRGNELDSKIEEYTNMLADINLSSEYRIDIEEKLRSLNENKNRLKGEIYAAALEKSGLNYTDGDISTMTVIKKHINNIEELKKEKQELEIQKAKQQEIIEQKKAKITAQFNVAVEKYKEMLDAKKISIELYEKRVISMSQAKEQDEKILDKSLESFDVKLKENSDCLANEEKTLEENQDKFRIYDEYDDVYYDLFGEPLDKFAKERYKIIKNSVKNLNTVKYETEYKEEISDNDDRNQVKDNKTQNQNKVVNKFDGNVVNQVVEISKREEKIIEVFVTSKTMFDNLYKKLTKGYITDEELNALAKVLENEDNYDKYGITTGLVFNKAKRILKSQGIKTAKNIDAFLQKSGMFAPNVSFNTDIENNDVLSHDLLNSWKNISKSVIFTDKEFSVEKYINEIEKYKEEGNGLTEEQEKIYEEAMKIKSQVAGYKKAVNTNEEVAIDRDGKMHNSILYNMFRNKFGKGTRETLPETSKSDLTSSEIMSDEVLDLSKMVNTSYQEQEVVISEDSIEKTRDDAMEI